jgi:uncharacterized repeat protein (TIGR03847 family)
MSVFFEFDEVDAFTAGAVGEPGHRVFFLQARAGRQRVTIRCEKQQVAAIVEYLRRVLSDLPPADDRPVPAAMELTGPPEEVFVLGPIGLGYDRANDRVLVQLEELIAADVEDDAPGAAANDAADRGHLRVFVSRGQAAAFCDHADSVVAAGRPPCSWCGLPIDPDGHACPRMN